MSNVPSENRCVLVSALGRRCREPRSKDHPEFCRYHARMQKQEEEQSDAASETTTLELLGPVPDFRSAASINHVLGKLLILLNSHRISPRNASVTAYICQLLLQSLVQVKSEIHQVEQDSASISPQLLALKQVLKAPPFCPPDGTEDRLTLNLFDPEECQRVVTATEDWPLLAKVNS
jgi:hypothetical protein